MTGTETTKKFQTKLEDLIFESGKTLRDIEKDTGISRAALNNYANDKAEIGINNIVKLAKYFNVSADYLLGLSESKISADYLLGLKETNIGDIKDNEKFLQFVCDYTGFNKEAVLYLKEMKYFFKNELDDKFYFEFLNKIIKSLIGVVFQNVEGYIFAIEKYDELVDNSIETFKSTFKESNLKTGIDYLLIMDEIKNCYDMLEFKKFQFQKSFAEAVDGLFLNKDKPNADERFNEARDEYFKALAFIKKENNGDTNADNNKA